MSLDNATYRNYSGTDEFKAVGGPFKPSVGLSGVVCSGDSDLKFD